MRWLLPLGADNSQSKVELYAAIHRNHRMGMSLRALQRTHNVTWRTVRRALDGQWPEPRKNQRRKESRLDAYKPLIDGMLLADLDAPPKQRHTAQRTYDRLVEGHGADGISYSMVRVYAKDRRKEVRRQAGVGPDAMFVPQTHLPGAEAEVDFRTASRGRSRLFFLCPGRIRTFDTRWRSWVI